MAYPRISTRKQRKRWYRQVYTCGKSVKEVCTIFGISRKCYYHWFKKDFRDCRAYKSKKQQPNTKMTHDIKRYIEITKRKTNYGPLKMKLAVQREFGVDISTTIIYRFFKRKMLIRKSQRRLPWYEPLKYSLTIKKPGEGVQMDIKYVYEQGIRKYQFSALDPYTRKYFFYVFISKHSVNAIRAFKLAETYFGFKIQSIQTDNGSEFRGEFHEWLITNCIPHYFIPKSSPYWNGEVERVHRTVDDEYYLNVHRIWKTPYQWLRFYNFERIHLSLGGLTPHEKYLKSVTLDC